MNQESVLKLKQYLQKITERPRPIDDQPHKREGVFLWCQDWEIIEILKCLFMGKEVYRLDPPPRRLRFNPLWNQSEITRQADELLRDRNGDVDLILADLKERRASRE